MNTFQRSCCTVEMDHLQNLMLQTPQFGYLDVRTPSDVQGILMKWLHENLSPQIPKAWSLLLYH